MIASRKGGIIQIDNYKDTSTYLQQPQRCVRPHQHIHASLHNARLLQRNLLDRIAQNLLMIQLHRGNYRQCHIRRAEDVCGVLSAAQPGF